MLQLGPNRDSDTTSSLIIYENHQRAAILYNKYNLNDLFVFCVARNPYDRTASWYQYHKNIPPYKSMSFRECILADMPHHVEVQNQTDYRSKAISPLLQWNYIEDYRINFIAKAERFEQDMRLAIRRLNDLCIAREIKYSFSFSKLMENRSNRKANWQDYYDHETKAIVATSLAKDFEYFKYAK